MGTPVPQAENGVIRDGYCFALEALDVSCRGGKQRADDRGRANSAEGQHTSTAGPRPSDLDKPVGRGYSLQLRGVQTDDGFPFTTSTRHYIR